MDRITDFARQAETRGFPGVWVGDSLGRGRPTLDSLQVLTALAAVTHRVELGIAVLQLPLRNPIELAHRVQSLQAMSNNRLILGVGSGSDRLAVPYEMHDFEGVFKGTEPVVVIIAEQSEIAARRIVLTRMRPFPLVMSPGA